MSMDIDTQPPVSPIKQLGDALEAGNASAVQSAAAAVVSTTTQRTLAQAMGYAVAKPVAEQTSECVMGLDELFKTLSTQGQDGPTINNEHMHGLRHATAEEWAVTRTELDTLAVLIGETLGMCAAAPGANPQTTTDFIRAPEPLSNADVAELLTSLQASVPSCSMGQRCPGFSSGVVLSQYFTRRQLLAYSITGHMPASTTTVCYLCLLAATHLAKTCAPATKLSAVQLPFSHSVNAPGGYVRSALHDTDTAATASPATALTRSFSMKDYRRVSRSVLVPAAFDDTTQFVTEWVATDVDAYEERRDLMYGGKVACNSQFCCETSLGRELLQPADVTELPFAAVAQLNEYAKTTQPATWVALETPFGRNAPMSLSVCATGIKPDRIVPALCWAPLEVARVRLVHVLHSAPQATALLFSAGIAPSTHTHYPRPQGLEAHGETLQWVLQHSLLVLTLLRANEITRLLAATGTSNSLRHRLTAYKTALHPLLTHFTTALRSHHQVDDATLFRVEQPSWALPYATLYPLADPVYFAPADMEAFALLNKTALSAAAGADMPRNYSLFESIPPSFFPAEMTVEHSLLCKAVQFSGLVCFSMLPVAAQWLAEQLDRSLPPAAFNVLSQIINADADPLAIRLGGSWVPAHAEQIVTKVRDMVGACAPSYATWSALLLRMHVLEVAERSALAALHAVVRPDKGFAHLAELEGLGPRVIAALETGPTGPRALADVQADVIPVLADTLPTHDQKTVELRAVLSAIRTARTWSAHIFLRLVDAGATDDASCYAPLFGALSDVPAGLSDEFGKAAYPSAASSGPPPSQLSRVLAEVGPRSTGQHTPHLDRLMANMEAEPAFTEFLAYCCARLFMGMGSGPAFMVSSATQVQVQAALYCDDTRSIAKTLRQLPEQVRVAALREFLADAVSQSFPFYAKLDLTYFGVADWVRAALRHADQVRDVMVTGVTARPPNMTRDDVAVGCRQTTSDTGQAFCTCCYLVDVEIFKAASMRKMAPVEEDDIAVPCRVLHLLEKIVRSLPAHVPFEPRLLATAGLCQEAVDLLCRAHESGRGSRATYSALLAIAVWSPRQYALVSAFANIYGMRQRWRAIALDTNTARRQLEAVFRAHGTYYVHVHSAHLGSLTCCNRLKNIHTQCTFRDPNAPMRNAGSVSRAYNNSGVTDTRLLLPENKLLCSVKRSRAWAETHSKTSSAAARAAIEKYIATLANTPMHNAAPERIALLHDERSEALQRVTKHAAAVLARVYKVPCGREILCVPLVGRIVEQANRPGNSGQYDNCTLCPRCSRHTSFAPAMFGPNGFTCGLCDADVRKVAEASVMEVPQNCCICQQSRMAAAISARKTGVQARFTPYYPIDDCNMTDSHGRIWLCSVCFRHWMPNAIRSCMVLSDILKLYKMDLPRNVRLDEIMQSSHDTAMLGKIAAVRAGTLPIMSLTRYPAKACSTAAALFVPQARDEKTTEQRLSMKIDSVLAHRRRVARTAHGARQASRVGGQSNTRKRSRQPGAESAPTTTLSSAATAPGPGAAYDSEPGFSAAAIDDAVDDSIMTANVEQTLRDLGLDTDDNGDTTWVDDLLNEMHDLGALSDSDADSANEDGLQADDGSAVVAEYDQNA